MKTFILTIVVTLITVLVTVRYLTGEWPVEVMELKEVEEIFDEDNTIASEQSSKDTVIISYNVKALSIGRKRDLSDIKYIVIHRTHNYNDYANALWHSNYMDTTRETKSWHWTVDADMSVNHLPYYITGHHCGNTKGNYESIGIEICENDKLRHPEAIARAAYLVKSILLEFPNAQIKLHSDFVNKNCPGFSDEEWAMFKYVVDVSR